MARRNKNLAYGIGDNMLSLAPAPIVAQRAPTVRDRVEIGTIWIDQPNDDSYILTSIVASNAVWINAGGGTGTFNALTVTTTATIGTTLLVGGVTTLSNLGIGVVQSGVTGILTSSGGTNGQILCGSTGLAPAWTAITSGTLVITPGAGTLNIEESGGTANSFVTDLGGPVAPLLGVTRIAGGTNITTDGTVANTITFDLDDNVTLAGFLSVADTLTMLAGDLTITADTDAPQTIYLHADGGTNETIEIYSDQGTGTASIYIHSDVGGLDLTSGLATADAINITCSDAAGGIDIDAGTSGIAIDSTGIVSIEGADACDFSVTGATNDLTLASAAGSVNVTAGEAVANAIVIDATNAAGGIDIDAGTGGISVVTANGTIAFESGTAAINVGVDAAAHTVTVGSVTTTAATVVQSGTGDLALTSTDAITLDAVGVLELNSSAGIIGIGSDADAFAINIGTGAAARIVTIGNNFGNSGVTLDAGTGAVNIGANAIAHTVTIGNATGAGAVAINAGSGDITATATLGSIVLESTEDTAGAIYLHTVSAGITDTIDLHNETGTAAAAVYLHSTVGGVTLNGGIAAAGALTLVASDAAGGIDIDYGTGGMTIDATNGAFTLQTGTGAVNIGTDAVQKIVTLGNVTGTTSVVVDVGTGAASFGASATAHVTTLGSINTTSQTILQSGTGDLNLTSTDSITLDCAGLLDLNSTGAAINIGNDADAFAVNVGTGAAARVCTVGSVNTTSQTIIQSGTGDLNLTSTDAITLDATGVIELNSTGADITIGGDADAHDVYIATGAAAKALTLGSTNTTSDTLVQAGTGGITLSAAGIVDMVPATASVAGTGLTIDANVGVATFTGQVTGATAAVTLTITNAVCTTGSAILCSCSNLGANDAQMTITRIIPGAGTFDVILTNNGAAALNGNIILTFWILAA